MHVSDVITAVWEAVYKEGIPASKFREAYEIADNIARIAVVEAAEDAKDEEVTIQPADVPKFRGPKIQKVYQALLQGPKDVSELKKVSGATITTIYAYVKQLKAKRHRDSDGRITYTLQ